MSQPLDSEQLPKGLRVGGDLYLSATPVRKPPQGLHVGGAIER